MNKKKKNILLVIIGSSSILIITFFMVILICVLMLFDFFGGGITKEKVESNAEFADSYLSSVNSYLKDGYVPIQRILYFHKEDSSLTFDTLYKINQNSSEKKTSEISKVCLDERVKKMSACSEENINKNKDYLVVTPPHFNFPLDDSYIVTSFFNEERVVYDTPNFHNGWDLSAPEKTPVYSVCSGIVYKVDYTQNENIPYDQSGNSGYGNSIVIKCDEDYPDTYYVTYGHLYPKSSKVKVGDKVNHWTKIASVGTTGYSTGNHLHYQVNDKDWNLLDGMQFIDFTLKYFK